MAYSPEFGQKKSSLIETGRFLFGALARTSLKVAILEAENARRPIDPQKMAWLKERFAKADYRAYARMAYWVYSSAWKREKGAIRGKLLHNFHRARAYLKRKRGRREQLVNEKIVLPLHRICTKIEAQEPDLSRPWLGELLIRAALEEENTEEVRSFLSQFNLNPEELVQEVYDALTAIGERDRMSLT